MPENQTKLPRTMMSKLQESDPAVIHVEVVVATSMVTLEQTTGYDYA